MTHLTPTEHRLICLTNAIRDAVREMERCPDDSAQDIWNEQLEAWDTGFHMTNSLDIEPNV